MKLGNRVLVCLAKGACPATVTGVYWGITDRVDVLLDDGRRLFSVHTLFLVGAHHDD